MCPPARTRGEAAALRALLDRGGVLAHACSRRTGHVTAAWIPRGSAERALNGSCGSCRACRAALRGAATYAQEPYERARGQVNFVAPFNSAAFPDALAIAKEGVLTIGSIDEIQKLHIRTVPLGEQPRRLAHQEATRTFAVATAPCVGARGPGRRAMSGRSACFCPGSLRRHTCAPRSSTAG